MTCQACAHWDLKAKTAMPRAHLAVCQAVGIWKTTAPTYRCNDFKPAPADVVSKRVKWLEKKA